MKLDKKFGDVKVNKSSRDGKGIFAKRNFVKDSQVFQVKGKIFTFQETLKIGGKFSDNTIKFDKSHFLSPEGELGNYLNHSCKPNCGVIKIKDELFIIAIRDLKAGEEITINYSTILADDDPYEMDCNCGSSKCRRRIKKFSSLPKKIRDGYINLGIIPRYILE